jgi:CheY-like chemotaxis protein
MYCGCRWRSITRSIRCAGNDIPNSAEIAAQARQVAELETQLDQYSAKGGQRMEVASRTLRQAEKDIGAALDGFSLKISEGSLGGLIEVRDQVGFQREIDRLKAEEIEARFRSVAAAVKPVQQWAGALKDALAPQLESVRSLKCLTERIRPAVLVVDDDAFQHKLLQKALADASIEAIFALTVMDGFAILRKRRPALILMDIDLPDVNGLEATRRLKAVEHLASIPVIMITGHSDRNVVVESLEAGASDFVVKPFNKDTLLAKVQGYLRGELHS